MQKKTEEVIEWIRNYFKTTCGENAVIGISGGKDSTIVAALCCKALGPEHVIGVMMPNGVQKDLNDSKEVCNILGIRPLIVDISAAYNDLSRCIYCSGQAFPELSQQTKVNMAPRLRMTTLYGIAQTLNGRVSCNGNLDERLMGYTTLWGDNVGDFAPIANLHVSEVLAIGDDLGLPERLVHKAPSDGLTGKTDEECFGFTYADVESMSKKCKAGNEDRLTDTEEKAYNRMIANAWKITMTEIPSFK